jgi:hypothetical protein
MKDHKAVRQAKPLHMGPSTILQRMFIHKLAIGRDVELSRSTVELGYNVMEWAHYFVSL